MPASTTPDSIVYPVVTDRMGPVEKLFEALASSVQTAITNLRKETVDKPLPAPVSQIGRDVISVSATTWSDLPNISTVSLNLSAPAWVSIDVGSWVIATSGDTRVSARVTGATTLSETQMEVGGATTCWGQVIYAAGSPSTRQQNSHRVVRLNAGNNVIAVRAYKSGGGSHNSNYTTLQVTPIRWA